MINEANLLIQVGFFVKFLVIKMGKFLRLHWFTYCLLVFIISRLIMLYEYNLASDILFKHSQDFFTTMCKWDCKWYITIIQNGYDENVRTYPKVWKGLANWAFFPLYPYTVKFLVAVTHLKDIVVGVLINQLLIFAAIIIFYKYFKLFVDELHSRFGIFLVAFSPFSIYFASVYTEAMFLFLSLSSFYFMRINRPYISAIFGGLLSATRPVGVMFSAAYLLYSTKKYGFKFKVILGFLIAISGLLLYMTYLHFHVGDALAFEHIQKGWGRKGIDTRHITSQLLRMLQDYHNSVLFIFSCIISLYLLWNKYFEEALFNFLCILPGVMTGQMMSEGRFSGTLFTFYLGLVLISNKSNSLKISLLIGFLVFYLSYFLYWIAHASFLI